MFKLLLRNRPDIRRSRPAKIEQRLRISTGPICSEYTSRYDRLFRSSGGDRVRSNDATQALAAPSPLLHIGDLGPLHSVRSRFFPQYEVVLIGTRRLGSGHRLSSFKTCSNRHSQRAIDVYAKVDHATLPTFRENSRILRDSQRVNIKTYKPYSPSRLDHEGLNI